MAAKKAKLKDLKFDEKNFNKHSEFGTSLLQKSLQKFGAGRSILIDKNNNIIAGNGVAEMAGQIGMEDVEIIESDGNRIIAVKRTDIDLNTFAGRELALADNQVAAKNIVLDAELIEAELGEAVCEEWGLDDGNSLQVEEDDFDAEPPQKPITKLGDLYELNGHRLHCADSADKESVIKTFSGKKPVFVFTDPPYGVAIGAKNRMLNSFQKAGRNLTDIADDEKTPEELKKVLLPVFDNISKLTSDEATIFVTAPQGGELGMMMMMREAGIPVRHVLIWKKNSPTFSMGRLDYDYQHEPIMLTWKKKHHFYGKGNHKTSIWEIDKPRASKEHPTMKPIALVANALLNNSKQGDICTDMFLGSGTTLLACDQLGRICYGQECDVSSPGYEGRYCDVIIARFIKYKRSRSSEMEQAFTIKRNGTVLSPEEIEQFIKQIDPNA